MESYDDMGTDLFWDDDFMMDLDSLDGQVPFDFDDNVADSQESDEMETEEQDDEPEGDSR